MYNRRESDRFALRERSQGEVGRGLVILGGWVNRQERRLDKGRIYCLQVRSLLTGTELFVRDICPRKVKEYVMISSSPEATREIKRVAKVLEGLVEDEPVLRNGGKDDR